MSMTVVSGNKLFLDIRLLFSENYRHTGVRENDEFAGFPYGRYI